MMPARTLVGVLWLLAVAADFQAPLVPTAGAYGRQQDFYGDSALQPGLLQTAMEEDLPPLSPPVASYGGGTPGGQTRMLEKTPRTDSKGYPIEQSRDSKLQVALDAIKEDIITKSRQVTEETAWVTNVKKILAEYTTKLQRVENNIDGVKGDVKALYTKKKQIENLIQQKALQQRLRDAQDDLLTLQKALDHVKTKQNEFSSTKQTIESTMQNIHNQLAKLQNVKDVSLDEEKARNVQRDLRSELETAD